MAPTKSNARAVPKQSAVVNQINKIFPKSKDLTRQPHSTIQEENAFIQTRGKRKADQSPMKNQRTKRSALGNLTNNIKMTTNNITNTQHPEEDVKQQFAKKKDNLIGVQANVLTDVQNVGGTGGGGVGGGGGGGGSSSDGVKVAVTSHQPQVRMVTRSNAKNLTTNKNVLNKTISTISASSLAVPTNDNKKPVNKKHSVATTITVNNCVTSAVPVASKPHSKPVRRISNEFNKTEESLYMSALEDVSSCESVRRSGNFEAAKRRSALLDSEKIKAELKVISSDIEKPLENSIPEGVEDFDKLNWNDIMQVSHYAMEIFVYLKEREAKFPIIDYMVKQKNLSPWMRSLLVDWMVEVQETFELNHETLYLAVKIVDLFLCRVIIDKDKLQLLGAAALFIACKYDERTPPFIEDFLYICDGAYKHNELIKMEMITLRAIDYDLGIPLSYRFLRRYSRCAKVPIPTLTLARYILELSLMDYATIRLSDSKLACAALFIALRMHGHNKPWTATLEYYTGYKLTDFADIIPLLNYGLHRKPKGTIKTIRSKYSHIIFHEVAKIPLLTSERLFENNLKIELNSQTEDSESD